ncbi:MAG: hypothetical protein ABIH23_30795, partial [bacterium]
MAYPTSNKDRDLPRLAMLLLCVLFLVPGFLFNVAAGVNGRIQPWDENPWYWEYKDRPILLLGGSDEDNLFNDLSLMRKNFEAMETCGGNYIRCTLSCRDEGNMWPFAQKNGHYDLDTFNPEFWNRLEMCVREAEKRNIIVQIELWATFDYYRDIWIRNPFNPANNSNYTTDNTKLVPEWNHHPAGKVQPFFFSSPGKNNDGELLKYQELFVQKVLDITLPYPNVLYCLDNETKAPEEWALHWAEYIRTESVRRGMEAQVTEMWDAWDLTDEHHQRTYNHPELFSYTDVSQNNWQVGQTHYDRLIGFRNLLEHQAGGIRPMNNVKVYMRQGGGKPNDADVNIDRWWQNVFAGCASTRFHRPPGGLGLSDAAQKVIRAARVFTSSFDIVHSAPRPDLLSDREENEAYCLAIPGKVYAVYFPKGGQ